MTVPLAETSAEAGPDAARLLPAGADLAHLRSAAAAEIAGALGPVHAGLFGHPSASAGGRVTWTAPGAEVRRFADLSAADRTALLAAAGAIVSDIRRLVESGRAPATASVWPALRTVPGPAALFAVDGRPVLAPWGRAGPTDILAPLDDNRAWVAPVRSRPWPYLAALGVVAVLALAGGLLLPAFGRWMQPPAALCRIDDGQLDLLRQQAAAGNRGEELKRLLASVNDDIGRQQLLCAIPTAPAATPPPVPPPPPPPAPRAELPMDRWTRRDLAMLDGCWHNSSQLNTRNEASGEVEAVREWRLCFDRSGHGRQTIVWNGGGTCDGSLSANFSDEGQLRLADAANCSGPGKNLRRGTFVCRRIDDEEADCTRTQTEGPNSGAHLQGRFHR